MAWPSPRKSSPASSTSCSRPRRPHHPEPAGAPQRAEPARLRRAGGRASATPTPIPRCAASWSPAPTRPSAPARTCSEMMVGGAADRGRRAGPRALRADAGGDGGDRVRQAGDRGGERLGGRLGHGAGALRRHPHRLGEGGVRRAVHQARPGLRRRRLLEAAGHRRPGQGRRAAVHRRRDRRRGGRAHRPGQQGRPARGPDAPRRRRWPAASPPTRRWRCAT